MNATGLAGVILFGLLALVLVWLIAARRRAFNLLEGLRAEMKSREAGWAADLRRAQADLETERALRRRSEDAWRLLGEVTSAAIAATTQSEAISVALEKIAQAQGWVLGQAWFLNGEKTELACDPEIVYVDEAFESCREASLQVTFRPGIGLPGVVWERKSAVWITDDPADGSFPRRLIQPSTGLESGFGFPILADGNVMAVLEFYSRERRAPDPGFMDVVTRLSQALGEISQRKNVEAALRESEERWRKVFEHAPIGIGLHKVGYCIDAANPALQHFFGYTEEELKSLTFMAITHPDDLEASDEIYRALADPARSVYKLQKRYIRKDGKTIWGDVTVTYMPATPTRPQVMIAVIADITDRKRAEEELAKAQAELAHMMRVTTMGELAASIAHEVNQPLAAVLTNGRTSLRWLAKDPPDLDEARQAVERVVGDAARASAIITRIRAMFKKEAAPKEPLDINEIIQELTMLLRTEAMREQIAVRTALDTSLPKITGDRVQLQQVILNLMMNAIDAMRSGDVSRRELLVTSQRNGSVEVQVAVHDHGKGLAQANFERVFQPFFTTKPHGIGMGLAISRSIIEAHGGRLWAEAGRSGGATFQFTLPLDHDRTDA